MDTQQNINGMILERLLEQQIKIDKIYSSVEKTRKYFLLTMIITVLTILIPLIGLAIAVPFLLNSMSSLYNPTQINNLKNLYQPGL
jgi:hypothetical protein